MRSYEVSDLNRRAAADAQKFIDSGERAFSRRLNGLVHVLYQRRNDLQIVLLTGPSASGKTTTAQMICEKLHRKGVTSSVVSLDNFYKNREDIPKAPDGRPDLETVHALDIRKINYCFKKLVTKGEAEFPIFDFLTDRRRAETIHVKAGPGELVIVEGIHALNPAIRTIGDEDRYYKVYISPRRPFCDGENEIISPSRLRLLRRMLRDYERRGATVQQTLAMWDQVRDGERKYIFPMLGTEDYFVETTHCYEPLLYKEELMELLETVDENDPWYTKTAELKASLRPFGTVSSKLLPPRTLMREFIDF